MIEKSKMTKIDVEKVAAKMDADMNRRLEQKLLPCAAAKIVKDGEAVYETYKGFADIENNVPLSKEHIFRLCSMSKPVTGVCVMKQIERGLINLSDPITKWLPEFSEMYIGTKNEKGEIVPLKKAERTIRVVDLMTHSNGLGSGPLGEEMFQTIRPGPGETLADVVPRYATLYLDYEPLSETTYSGVVGLDVMARVVEMTSDMTFYEFIKKELTGPLGMTDTMFAPTPEQDKRMVTLYESRDNELIRIDLKGNYFDRIPPTYESGSSGLLGTMEDYYTFCDMLLHWGSLNGVQILRPESVDLMRQGHLPVDLPGLVHGVNWGIGVRAYTEDDSLAKPMQKGYYGWSGAYGTHMFIGPAEGLIALYFSNITNAGGSGAPTIDEINYATMDALIR